jgi:hypothetical protein
VGSDDLPGCKKGVRSRRSRMHVVTLLVIAEKTQCVDGRVKLFPVEPVAPERPSNPSSLSILIA